MSDEEESSEVKNETGSTEEEFISYQEDIKDVIKLEEDSDEDDDDVPLVVRKEILHRQKQKQLHQEPKTEKEEFSVSLPRSSVRQNNRQKKFKSSSSSVSTKGFKIKMKRVPCLLNKDCVNVTCDRCAIQFTSLSKFLNHLHPKFKNINISNINNKSKSRHSILKSSLNENLDDSRRKRSHVHFEPEDSDGDNNNNYFDGGDDNNFSDNDNEDDTPQFNINKKPKSEKPLKRRSRISVLQQLDSWDGQILITDFGCSYCSKTFRKEEHLELHIKVVHPETLPPPPSPPPPPKVEEIKITEVDDNKIEENDNNKDNENDSNPVPDIGNDPVENNLIEEEEVQVQVDNCAQVAEGNDNVMDTEEIDSSTITNIIEEPEQNEEISSEQQQEQQQPETTKRKRGRKKIKNLKHRKFCPFCPETCKSYRGLEIHMSIHHRNMPEPVEEIVTVEEENNIVEEEEQQEEEEEIDEVEDDIEEEDDSGSDVDYIVKGKSIEMWAPFGSSSVMKSKIRKEIQMIKNPPPKPVKEKKVPEQVMCEECGRISASPQIHKQHLLCHSDERFVCTHPGCTKSFRRKEYLSTHLKLHRGILEYVCEHCGKGYVSKSNLTVHLLTHNEKNFKCDQCEFATVHKMSLSLHIRALHDGARPFSCSLCTETFKYRAALRRHTFEHTGIKPFKCKEPECDYDCFTSAAFQNHVRTQHQNLPPITKKRWKKKKVPQEQDQQQSQSQSSTAQPSFGNYQHDSSSQYQSNQPIQHEQEQQEEEDYESESDDDEDNNEAAVNSNTNFY